MFPLRFRGASDHVADLNPREGIKVGPVWSTEVEMKACTVAVLAIVRVNSH